MQKDKDKPYIISASRTKDMVHRCPDLLARIITGEAPCRWSPQGPLGRVDLSRVHTVVLWTKNPANLLHHTALRKSLLTSHQKFGVGISLQITATALGGTFVEPGMPHWSEVYDHLKELLEQGWIDPEAVVYRYDPFLTLQTPRGGTISNANLSVFKELCSAFISLKIKRVTSSRADVFHYPKVTKRIESFNLTLVPLSDEKAITLCQQMDAFCRSCDADFSICCNPSTSPQLDRWGCIDSRKLNTLKNSKFEPATELFHNQVGRQRPECKCTYSRDIGYSAGSTTCFRGGFGCMYCYAQSSANFPHKNAILAQIQRFENNPINYLNELNLPEELAQ